MNNEQEHLNLFDAEAAYREHIVPLLEQLMEACNQAGVDYAMQFCFLHQHPEEFCQHGVGTLMNVDGSRDPIHMIVASKIARMDDESVRAVDQIIDGIDEIMEAMSQTARVGDANENTSVGVMAAYVPKAADRLH